MTSHLIGLYEYPPVCDNYDGAPIHSESNDAPYHGPGNCHECALLNDQECELDECEACDSLPTGKDL